VNKEQLVCKFAVILNDLFDMGMKENQDREKFIDVDKIIISKSPTLYKALPKFVIRYFKRLFHQDDLNDDLWNLKGIGGVDKFDTFLKMKNIKLELVGIERLDPKKRYVFASNHPLGGPDGVIFGSAIGKFQRNLRFLVNDLLMNIPDMEGFFVPVNKLGANSRETIKAVDDVYKNDDVQVLIFPAGLVSRKQNGVIKDLEWNKSFLSKAVKYERDIVPVYISGRNSNFFYNLARFRKMFHIKANLEMLFLIDEFYKHKNETIVVYLGEPIPYQTFDSSKKMSDWAQYVKEIVYSLPLNK